jgi:DNA-binding transcriptional LysR family regulator
MELRHLRYFLAVVECGSVAEAARRLHIVQPALSRQIRDLEEELGSDLFHRNAKGVELTVPGAQFAVDTRRLLAELETARELFVRVARGQSGALKIGIAPNYSWHPATLTPVRHFKVTHPDVTVILEPALAAKQLAHISSGALDGGFLAWRDPHDPVFAACHLFDCRLRLAVPRPADNMAPVVPKRLADLKDEPFMWFAREVAPAYYDFLIHQCQLAGFSPRIVPIGGDVSTILGLVAAGMGYAIVPEACIYSCPNQVVLVDHAELTLSYPVEFVWRADAVNPVLDAFVATVEAARTRDHSRA